MKILIIALSFGASAYALFMYIGKKLSTWAKSIEREMPDHNDETNICPQEKIDAYRKILHNLNACRTKQHLEAVYNMLNLFRNRYGKCEMYCGLYADYVSALWEYNERDNLQYTI